MSPLQKFFAGLYEPLVGFFEKQPRLVGLSVYREKIFQPVGLWTLLMALGLVLIYYFVINGKDTVAYLKERNWFSLPKWLLTLLLAAGLGAWLAYYIGLTLGAPREPYMQYFIVVNALVAAFWFGLASLLAKRNLFSSHARITPF